MKKFRIRNSLTFVFALATSIVNAQQTPYLPVNNYFPTSASQSPPIYYPYGITSPTSITTPVYISGSAQANFVAGERIRLHDGFRAGDFSNNGYFRGQIGTAADFEVMFMQPNQNTPTVGQCEKLEIGVQLPSSIEQQVNNFLVNGTGLINPFDPDQISIEANFSNGPHHYTVYGFYYDEFVRDANTMTPFTSAAWIPQSTNYHWRIRFAPPFQGYWTCTISIRLNNSPNFSYQVNNIFFTCVPSSNQGWLKKGNDNWHLAFTKSNTSFFALGQNIGWNDEVVFRGGIHNHPVTNYPIPSGGFLDVQDWVSNLSNEGGNMVRLCMMPWSFELESNRLNNYSDRLDRAWELDKLVELCELKDLEIAFSFYDKRWQPNNPNPDLTWASNPYHLYIPGVIYAEDFLTNSTAKQIFKKKIRYFLSRWGYSTSLGIFELMSEINPDNNTFHDYDLALNALYNWNSEMMTYSKSIMSYRTLLTTTSYATNTNMHNTNDAFYLPNCDITALHKYHNDRGMHIQHFNEFNQHIINSGTHTIWPEKPTYFEEMGLIENPVVDVGDIERCSDMNLHNSLWATAFMGGFGAGFPWWVWNSNTYRHDNYPALNSFFSGIDFQQTVFNEPDFWDDALIHNNSKLENFYIREENGSRVMGWVHNSTYWWGNVDQNCVDRNNLTLNLSTADDDSYTSPQTLPLSTKFEIHGLNNLQDYTLEWYETRNNGGLFQTETWQANILGTMKPIYQGSEPLYYAPDWAFKAYRAGNNFRHNTEITSDTLFCWQDTLDVRGNHESDSLDHFSYYWNFGNGQISDEKNTFVIYNQPGTYLVILIVSDSLGWSDTLQQYIVKPQPCSSARISDFHEPKFSSSWNVFPNPVSNNLTLTFDSSWSSTILVELYSLDGRCILSQSLPLSSNNEIPIVKFPSGAYLLRVTDRWRTDVKRIIVDH